MWQLLVLSVFLTSANADFQDFYGNWTAVMVFPENVSGSQCFKVSVLKENDQQCQCDDGKPATVFDFNYPEYPTEHGKIFKNFKKSYPILEAKTAAQVVVAFGMSCRCGEGINSLRLAVRRINDDYFIVYQPHTGNKDKNGLTVYNTAIVHGRTVQTAAEIQKIVNQVEGLSERTGRVICSAD